MVLAPSMQNFNIIRNPVGYRKVIFIGKLGGKCPDTHPDIEYLDIPAHFRLRVRHRWHDQPACAF